MTARSKGRRLGSYGQVSSCLEKSKRAERFPIDTCPAFGDPLADEFCRDGSKQNSVAVVARGENQTIDIHGPQDGKLIRRAWPQAAPGLDDFRFRQFGRQLIRRGENSFDAA